MCWLHHGPSGGRAPSFTRGGLEESRHLTPVGLDVSPQGSVYSIPARGITGPVGAGAVRLHALLEDPTSKVDDMNIEVTRRNGLRQVAHDVRRHPAPFLLFTAYKTFAVLLFLQGFFFGGTFEVAGVALPLLAVFLLACAGVFLFFALCFKRITVVDKDGYLWALAASMTLGVFFLYVGGHGGMIDEGVRVATLGLGMAMLAGGTVGVHVELGRLFGMLGMTPTMTYGIASALATGVLSLAVALMSPEARWALAFVMPAVIVLAFCRARASAFPDRRALYRDSTIELLIPYRFLATSVTQGLALGVPLGFMSLSGVLSQELDSVGYVLAALLALLAVLVLQMDFNRSIYQIGFPLAAGGLLAAGLLGPASPVAALLQVTGFLYLDLVLWGLGSYLIKNCDQPATWLSSCPSAALMTGRALGIVAGSVALQVLVGSAEVMAFFCVLAFLMLMAALLLTNGANLRTGWGFVRPGGPDEATGSARTCEVIAQEFGLTQREGEIMHSIIRGKSRKEIAEDLFVTPNTIKTHLHNLYGKLDIHSEADLKAFVAKRERMFSTPEDSRPLPPE